MGRRKIYIITSFTLNSESYPNEAEVFGAYTSHQKASGLCNALQRQADELWQRYKIYGTDTESSLDPGWKPSLGEIYYNLSEVNLEED